jgi:hypothetical protein
MFIAISTRAHHRTPFFKSVKYSLYVDAWYSGLYMNYEGTQFEFIRCWQLSSFLFTVFRSFLLSAAVHLP